MTTISKEIRTGGKTLMKNLDCGVVIKPSKEGIIRLFVKGADKGFKACIDNVISTEHNVTLGSREHRTLLGTCKYKAGLCEHFMAACAFLRINSVDVYLSVEEFPIFDGSSKVWVELFKEAGLTDKPKKQTIYTVKEPVYYINGKTSLVILPDDDLNITYSVNYDHCDLKRQWVSFNPDNHDEIIEARTFGFYKDLKKYQMLGFAHGVTIENTLGLTDEGYTTNVRSDKEPIKHKILDLFGDIYQTGVSPLDLKCRILVKEAGHAVHIKAAKLLKDKLVKIK
ncbi:MAG: UDP-3-O-acyl-N-acetylglucosamine deacetylase [Candidatus Gastranaerophilales bacterium]|nr:UDP-3-O-acyl-N-acetylglucosamine deacetylase [Candidatus Gastranaerophilales bacterium]